MSSRSINTWLSAGILCMCLMGPAIAGEPDYRLVWQDEFDCKQRINEQDWGYENGFVRNREMQWYHRDNAFCRDGYLVLEGRTESKANPNFEANSKNWRKSRKTVRYTSASVTTKGKHAWQFGRFEVRAKIVAQEGLWPAIWFMGQDGKWPSNGEIDLMEYYLGMILANAAWGGDYPAKPIWDATRTPLSHFNDAKWDEKFHVWRMDWDADAIKLYVDDELLNQIDIVNTVNPEGTSPQHPFLQPHYLILNLAIGGQQGGNPVDIVFPSPYIIDYVRVYQKSGE
jgi:beta-glucanase (GH16 family)